jgi:hypothetical protein
MKSTSIHELIRLLQDTTAQRKACGDILQTAAEELSDRAHDVIYPGVAAAVFVRQFAEVHAAASTLAACRTDGSTAARHAQEALAGIALMCDRRGTELSLLRLLTPSEMMATIEATMLTHY